MIIKKHKVQWARNAMLLLALAFAVGCADDQPEPKIEESSSATPEKPIENLGPAELEAPQVSNDFPAHLFPVSAVADDAAGNWPEFRGSHRSGHYAGKAPPLHWNDQQNLLWRTRLPGPGTSSPVVWGSHVYVTCYSGYGEDEENPGDVSRLQRHLVCVERSNGEILWTADRKNSANVFPFQQFNALHGYATSTPVVDNDGIYIFYGSDGAVAYTHDGELRWQKDCGDATHSWGTAASPILFDDLLIVLADIEGGRLIALEKNTGEPAWEVRTGNGDSWSTPLITETADGHELIFHHSQGDPDALIQAVDPRDGTPLWECRALKNYLAPSPIAADGKCFAIAYQRAVAIRLGGRGDVSATHIEWRSGKGTEICTPIYHEGHLYWAHQDSGIAYCLDAGNGSVVYEERIQPRPGRMYASGVLANGHIYYTSRENGVFVIKASPEYQQVAHNQIASDRSLFNATPAISDGSLLLRSNQFLYRVGERP